jgi:hypothetical protein
LDAARSGADLPIEPLGAGSDFGVFLQHLGVPAVHLEFDGEGATQGSYHSVYDSFTHVTRFDDPDLAYATTLSKLAGHLVLRASDADIPLARYTDLATSIARYVTELKQLVKDQNMIYAPGRFTGYATKTLPGVREAIEERRFEAAQTYIPKVAAALNAYADRLDQAAALKAKM